MFATTSKKLDAIDRVGSSSMRPFAGGRVDVLPPDARPWEEIYLSLQEQKQVLITRLQPIQNAIDECNGRLQFSLPKEEFIKIARRREIFTSKRTELTEQITELNAASRQAAKNCYGFCFLHVAREMLTAEQFDAVKSSADQAFGEASVVPFKAMLERSTRKRSEMTPEQRAADNKRGHAKQDRRACLHPNSRDAVKLAEHQRLTRRAAWAAT